ncbi:MFS transporter [Pseudomonas extremaustralis]|uniref:MFS transporter n=1 Tax=Pseudomonas extremaustralis TaxID=359110 RepID=UPI0021CA37E1|nr:MFS transporter [Pseudomonas extremaustralis]UUJ40895.1 MFS transporter [Pseudomonas extremaustralis]
MASLYVTSGGITDAPNRVSRTYAWIVFAFTFGLLISDYMSRQVLNAVFPLLKQEWVLTDAQLGLLSSIVSLMVGLLTFPLSLLADRWGRVKSLVIMAALWSFATLGCGLAENYEQMFVARFLVGVGEAAYGSVGIAVVLSVFPRDMRATVSGAFMAGGMLGSVLGMALGGVLAQHFGWRWAFVAMSVFGLGLTLIYPLVVKESRIGQLVAAGTSRGSGSLRTLYASRSVICAYIGGGMQLFVGAAVIVWFPSYLNRYYAMGTDQAGTFAALIVLMGGVGMILCGVISDRLGSDAPGRKINFAIALCSVSCIVLLCAFQLSPGPLQLALVGLGMLVATGTCGPAGAMVANLTHPAVHATAFATLALCNNLLGLAPGPFVIGLLADLIGLDRAFQLLPLVSVITALVFLYARRYYEADIQKLGRETEEHAVPGDSQ